ncbi:hypothetical protein [Thalassoroseus pseudoceratinae]|uniref:hypothetical protein n=1 Tax=Thalassoroseus pseudoceratinae TaxID=2713176 RepID=UPI00142283B0|nr:hypothetical protein [Thalassoroseus pseudoceratinae]
MRKINKSQPTRNNPQPTRGGFLYVAVLLVTIIVSMISLAAMSVAQSQLKMATGTTDIEQIRVLARSGIELGMAQIQSDSNWQANIVHGTEHPSSPVGANGGTMTWRLDDDPGGNGKLLTGIGRKDGSEYRLQVGVGTGGSNTVGVPMLVGGTLWVGNYTTDESLVINGGPIRCNSTVTNWGILNSDLEAQGFSNTGSYSGTATVPGGNHAMPDPQTVFDYYVSQGTAIPTGPLDDGLGGLSMDDVLFSPSNNPYGTPNSDGIYIIDCGGKSLSMQNLRVVGTLVIINGGTGTTGTSLKKEVNFEPAYNNYPSLLVQGDLELRITSGSLSEADAGTNFNPSGTPWQGNTDSDTSDSYPSRMAGIVYATGNMTLHGGNKNESFLLNGVLICNGNVVLEKQCQASVDFDSTASNDPPPGFGSSNNGEIIPGTWTRVSTP